MKRLVLMLSVLCFAVACGNDDSESPENTPKDPIVIPDGATPPTFNESGGSSSFTFTAHSAWTADVAATRAINWCRVSPTSGGKGEVTLSIATDPNDTPDERNATVSLKSGETTKTFTVTQKQKDALTLTSSKIEIEAAGGVATVEVKANISFEYEIGADCKEWITYSGTRAMQTSRLEFNVAENDDTALREGSITIRSSKGAETVKVYQSGAAPVLVLTQRDYTVAAAGETIKVEIKSNIDYEVTMPQAGWIKESGTRAISTHTHYYTISANEDYDARSAEIVFTNKANNLSQKVTITQVQKNAVVVAQNSYTVTNAGGEIKISVNHNVDFDMAIGADWVTQVGTRAMTTDNLTFKVAENTGYDKRETKITFTSKDKAITQEVKVYQAQKNAIIVSKKEYTLTDAGGDVEIEVRANVDFTVEGPGVAWLRKIETRALTTHTLRYTADANATYDPRTATIKITNKDNGLSDTVTITQVQKDAIVLAKSEYELSIKGGALDFDVMTNVSLTVAISTEAQSWIKQVQTRGLEKKTLHFDISACSQNDDRTGTITISGGGVTQKVTVTQNGLKEILEKERAALIAFYNAAGGENWKNNTNWCSDKPVSEWYGVECNASKQVTLLEYYNNNLKGTISPELGSLSQLNYLNLIQNQLTGSIPTELGKLSQLKGLSLNTNQLTGSIPPELGKLSQLAYLDLGYNQLTGSIPTELSKLSQLIYLELYHNQLTGSIPTELGKLSQLKVLTLFNNQLTGTIPKELGNMPQLQDLYLGPNQLTGSIPTELGKLSQLQGLSLGSNKLTGSIPASFANLTKLVSLTISFNNLSGTIPSEVVKSEMWKKWGVPILVQGPGLDIESAPAYIPEFTHTDMDGNTINSTTKFAAKKYTALFYWTYGTGNFQVISDLVKIYNGFRNKNFEVIGFCLDGQENQTEARAMITDYKMNWCNILERGNMDAVGVRGVPSVLIVDHTGMLKWRGSGSLIGPDMEAFLQSKLGDPTDPDKPYESTDYSADGKVTTLQKATRGNGIDIVLMGDAYSDRLIADGTYNTTMRKAMDYFFTEEPYKSFRDCFNVYSVNAVSKNEEYGSGMQTAFNGFFGKGTHVGGNDIKCKEYAKKIPGITDSKLGSTQIIVMMNRKYYAGTCYMYYPSSGDYSQGLSVSYFPFLNDEDFKNTLHHEAGGHGFPKLADEYSYQSMGAIPQDEIDDTKQLEPYGWWKNADFTSNVSTIKWSKFISDSRYAAEALGAYEGGLTYWTGVWRPTENSIMRYNTGGFNAPSREAIYYRINKLAFGTSWTYNYEDFVTYDAINRTGRAPMLLRTPMAEPKNFVPLHPPVVVMEKQ